MLLDLGDSWKPKTVELQTASHCSAFSKACDGFDSLRIGTRASVSLCTMTFSHASRRHRLLRPSESAAPPCLPTSACLPHLSLCLPAFPAIFCIPLYLLSFARSCVLFVQGKSRRSNRALERSAPGKYFRTSPSCMANRAAGNVASRLFGTSKLRALPIQTYLPGHRVHVLHVDVSLNAQSCRGEQQGESDGHLEVAALHHAEGQASASLATISH